MSRAKSLDMQRAEHALQAVEALEGEDIGHYVSYVRALPANILQNGLGQSLATLLAASKDNRGDPHRLLYDQIQSWLCRQHEDAPYSGVSGLFHSISAGFEPAYLLVHVLAFVFLVWLKIFSVAFLD